MSADEYAIDVRNDQLSSKLGIVKTTFPFCKIFYVIEGLNSYFQRKRTAENRDFRQGVIGLSGGDGKDGILKSGKLNNETEKDILEEGLVWLQMQGGMFVLHAKSYSETAEWIGLITREIAVLPYQIRYECHSLFFKNVNLIHFFPPSFLSIFEPLNQKSLLVCMYYSIISLCILSVYFKQQKKVIKTII